MRAIVEEINSRLILGVFPKVAEFLGNNHRSSKPDNNRNEKRRTTGSRSASVSCVETHCLFVGWIESVSVSGLTECYWSTLRGGNILVFSFRPQQHALLAVWLSPVLRHTVCLSECVYHCLWVSVSFVVTGCLDMLNILENSSRACCWVPGVLSWWLREMTHTADPIRTIFLSPNPSVSKNFSVQLYVRNTDWNRKAILLKEIFEANFNYWWNPNFVWILTIGGIQNASCKCLLVSLCVLCCVCLSVIFVFLISSGRLCVSESPSLYLTVVCVCLNVSLCLSLCLSLSVSLCECLFVCQRITTDHGPDKRVTTLPLTKTFFNPMTDQAHIFLGDLRVFVFYKNQ